MSAHSKGRGVLVIDTGGTITMMEGEGGKLDVAPAEKVREKLSSISPAYKLLSEGDDVSKQEGKWWHYKPLDVRIDSSNAKPETWQAIAAVIRNEETSDIFKYDGYVVLHGTDTLAYVSAGLAFLFLRFSKPIIITGAQVPMFSPRTDAVNNLLGSMEYATYRHSTETMKRLRGQYVFFHGKLMRATCIVKVDSQRWDAFHSPRAPLVGEIKEGQAIVYEKQASRKMFFDTRYDSETPKVHKLPPPNKGPDVDCPSPLVIQLFPGINLNDFSLEKYRKKGAVIISAFGSGNGPSSERETLMSFVEDGGLVAVVTECLSGRTASTYAACVADWDKKKRIAVCETTTLPAAYAKVATFLGNPTIFSMPPAERQKKFVHDMGVSWSGEIQYDDTARYLQALEQEGTD